MPSLTLSFGPAGPLVQAYVGLSAPHANALKALGKVVPPLVIGTFLLDTGATGTCVDPELVLPLGLTPTGAVMVQTPTTAGNAVSCPQYDISLLIQSTQQNALPLVVSALPVMETALRSQGIDGLIGRDIIDRCILNYNGPFHQMVLAY